MLGQETMAKMYTMEYACEESKAEAMEIIARKNAGSFE
jgi:hypothetical protein